ncbi:MAG TPA: type 4a pilus biogenesis protein PilO [Candidatus Omnitrophota bacterium]|nr:type 4a pilus biogenesis protein PilO [Candidatus Omnitrophota bacterium]
MKKQHMIIVYSVSAVLCVWIVVRFVFGPFHEKLSSLSQEASLTEEKLKKGMALLAKKEAINKEYDRYASYFSVQNVSDEEATAIFLKEVEKVGRESGVTILDMKPQKETDKDKIAKQYSINIKAEGGMDSLVDFLYSLHSSKLLLSIERIVLAPKGENASVLNITIVLAGVAFL